MEIDNSELKEMLDWGVANGAYINPKVLYTLKATDQIRVLTHHRRQKSHCT